MEGSASIKRELQTSANKQKVDFSEEFAQRIQIPALLARRSHRIMTLQRLSEEQQHQQLSSSALNLSPVPKQKIYENVFNLIIGLIDNRQKEQDLLKRFEQLQGQFQSKLKKSNKSIYKSRPMTKSTSYTENQQKTDVLMKKKSSLRPPPLLYEPKQKENVSIKVINSKSSALKQNKPPFQDNYPNLQVQDTILLEAINSEKSIQQIPSTQSIKIVRFNIQSPEKQKAQNLESIELSEACDLMSLKVFLYKQCSINMLGEEENEKQSQLFQSEGVISITNPELPEIPFCLQVLQYIFDSPSPFFINFAVSIFIKCLIKSKIVLKKQNVVSVLGICTLVSYKAYFDETVDGLIDHFSSLLDVSDEKIRELQRWFLQAINFEVGVSSQEYQQIMFQLINKTK